jgi:hypothetical protein
VSPRTGVAGSAGKGATLCLVWKSQNRKSMTKGKKKPSKFTAAREARRRAREVAGPPPVQRVIPDKRIKPPKHKKDPLESSDQ